MKRIGLVIIFDVLLSVFLGIILLIQETELVALKEIVVVCILSLVFTLFYEVILIISDKKETIISKKAVTIMTVVFFVFFAFMFINVFSDVKVVVPLIILKAPIVATIIYYLTTVQDKESW